MSKLVRSEGFTVICNKVSFLGFKKNIQKIGVFVMLLLFSFSITPKNYLHDWAASHVDVPAYHPGNEIAFSQAGFSCDCQDLVVSAPFIEASFNSNVETLFAHTDLPVSSYYFSFSNTYRTKDSRGPPAIV